MKFKMRTAAVAILAASVVFANAQAGGSAPKAKKHVATKKVKTEAPAVEEQIKALRNELQSQINELKSDLATKDAQLKQAQQSAADAQQAAAKAEADATAQQQSGTENAAAVSTLQSTVSDLKTNQVSLATTVSDETTALKKSVAEPDTIHYKGITISPAGSFVAAETTWRSGALASDINTPFTKIPLAHSEAAQVTEFSGSGRQSRIALKATGKLNSVTLTGYYEADWLSAGATSNGNQSNSYTMRQRQLWAEAKFNNGWDFSAGQGWSLATETTQGLSRGSEILPGTIDAAYTPGFVWTRQYSARVTKNFGKRLFAGLSIENPETLDPSCLSGTGSACATNALVSVAGNTSGLYNSGNDYSFNLAPDVIAKIAVEPGWGHWELFGIGRFYRDRIYPCSTISASCTVPTTATPYNSDMVMGAGLGGSFRGPLFQKKLVLGLKGLYGQGVGRYGDSTIADVTLRPNETLSPLHGFSALSSVDINPTSKLNIYFNYGGDYIGRDYVLSGTTKVGYGINTAVMTGCNTENNTSSSTSYNSSLSVTPSNCTGSIKDTQAFVAGYWLNLYNGPKGRFRQGIQYSNARRDIWSGNGGTTNPGNGANGEDNMLFISFRYYLP
jgi:Skp family chaperone for outer membrane proteins